MACYLLKNPAPKLLEFEGLKIEAGSNSMSLVLIFIFFKILGKAIDIRNLYGNIDS